MYVCIGAINLKKSLSSFTAHFSLGSGVICSIMYCLGGCLPQCFVRDTCVFHVTVCHGHIP